MRSVELILGGYGGPLYGRGLGGLVTVGLRALDEPGFHGSVAADTIDASASVRAQVTDKLHVAVAARKSYLDTVLSDVTSEDVGQYVPVPRYWDGQARAVYEVAPHETVEVGGLVSSDRTTRNNPAADPSLTTSSTAGTDFNRVYARYEKHTGNGSVIVVTPSIGTDSTSLVNAYGSTITELTSRSWVYGLRAGWQGPIEKYLRGSVGIDAEMQVSSLHRAGSIGAPPREGDLRLRPAAARADQRRRLEDRGRQRGALRRGRLLAGPGPVARRAGRAPRALRHLDQQAHAASARQPEHRLHS